MNAYGMDAYGMDLSLLEYGMSDQILESLYPRLSASKSPPQRRHDGTSPLPLGMDWSPPPPNWNGHDTIWPHDPHTGWSYCATIPSWSIEADSRGSGPTVFYRVQVGLQTPEAITTTRSTLHRFSDFWKLYSEIKKSLPMKKLPLPPPRKLLSIKSQRSIEERKRYLEEWMEKLLSDIDISRSAPVAIFLELEAAARSSFDVLSGNSTCSFPEYQPSSNVSMVDTSSDVSNYADDTVGEKAETPRHEGSALSDHTRDDSTSDICTSLSKDLPETIGVFEHTHDRDGKDIVSDGEIGLYFSDGTEGHIDEDLKFPSSLIMALPSEQRHKFSRVLVTLKQRVATAKVDMEDAVARLNQELAVRQYLTTKVKDLEVELETTRENTKDNLQQALSMEKERFTQMQWDLEESRKKCLEMELKLTSEQDAIAEFRAENEAVTQENEMLKKELYVAREELQNLQRQQEESEGKLKTDIKVLVKEVKSLRGSHSELKQELSRLMKQKLELEKVMQQEKHIKEGASSFNEKLLHECAILQKRLQECSVNFSVKEEEEDKLVVDAPSQADAIDLLNTSNNRIGLLLAEAQLVAQDIENAVASIEKTSEDELRKMLADIFIDNATLRKQINSALRCALSGRSNDSEKGGENEEEATPKKSVLSNFL